MVIVRLNYKICRIFLETAFNSHLKTNVCLISGGCGQGLKRVWVCGRGAGDEGPLSRRLLSCLLVGLPLVLHPVIFLRLLLHRLLSSMQQLTKWKSRSSWASHSSGVWRARSSSTDTDASTLRTRRNVNLTLDFASNASQEKVPSTPGDSGAPSHHFKEALKAKGSLPVKSDSTDEKASRREHPRVSSSRSHGGSSLRQSQKQRQQKQFGLRHHSSDNQRDGGGSAATESAGSVSGSGGKGTGGWRFRETLVALSTIDVSDTLQQFLPSRLRGAESRTSLSSSSKNSSPGASPSFFHRKSFRFSGIGRQQPQHQPQQNIQKEDSHTLGEGLPKERWLNGEEEDEGEDEEEGSLTPPLSISRNLEEYIMAFQRQLVNLPSYDRGDGASALRPRSRSVPRVTFEGEGECMSRATPVTRSPSLTPEMNRGSSSAHIRSSQLQLPICPFPPSLTVPPLRPTLSANTLYSPRRTPSPSGKSHVTSTPLHASPHRSPTLSRSHSPVKRPRSCSPFLSPSSQHPSPSPISVVSSPRLLSPAVSPISPPRPIEDPRRPSSASSSLTPTPYRRLDSPVYIVVDIPVVHRAVLACVEVRHFCFNFHTPHSLVTRQHICHSDLLRRF